MHARETQHGVLAHAEARGDARPVERGTQEATAQAATLGVEPVRAVRGFVAPDGEVAAGHAERGVQHLAVAQEPAGVGAVAFEQDGEVVAGPEFALQVELVAEDRGSGHGRGARAHRPPAGPGGSSPRSPIAPAPGACDGRAAAARPRAGARAARRQPTAAVRRGRGGRRGDVGGALAALRPPICSRSRSCCRSWMPVTQSWPESDARTVGRSGRPRRVARGCRRACSRGTAPAAAAPYSCLSVPETQAAQRRPRARARARKGAAAEARAIDAERRLASSDEPPCRRLRPHSGQKTAFVNRLNGSLP